MPDPSDVASAVPPYEKSVSWERGEGSVWGRGFTMIPNVILLDAGLSSRAIGVYLLLSHYSWRPEEYPGQDRLAAAAGCTEKTLRGAIKELVDGGFVKSRRRGLGKTNTYVLVEPKGSVAPEAERSRIPVQDPAETPVPSVPLQDRKAKTETHTERRLPTLRLGGNVSEQEVADQLQESGYEVLKRGWPDFLAIRDDGTIKAVEVKRTGQQLKPAQERVIEALREAGIEVEVAYVDTPVGRVPARSEVAIPAPANRPKTVDRKTVTDAEYFAAVAALDIFNSKAGTRYQSADWVSKIIMRIREHPDLPTVGHAAIIFTAFNDPWWTGVPSPSVVYGNAALFERSIHAVALAAEGGGNVTPEDAATYGKLWGPGTAYATAAEARAAGASAQADAVDADFEEIHDAG